MGLKLITVPTDEPFTVEEVKNELRVSGNDHNERIARLIEDARQVVEDDLHSALITQVWELTRDYFEEPTNAVTSTIVTPVIIALPYSPVATLKRISYVDSSGVTQLLHDEIGSPTLTANVVLDSHSMPARISPVSGSWPATASRINAVTIRYEAGYGPNGDSVPGPLRRVMLMLIAHWFEHPEAVNVGNITSELPLSAQWILDRYRSLVMA